MLCRHLCRSQREPEPQTRTISTRKIFMHLHLKCLFEDQLERVFVSPTDRCEDNAVAQGETRERRGTGFDQRDADARRACCLEPNPCGLSAPLLSMVGDLRGV